MKLFKKYFFSLITSVALIAGVSFLGYYHLHPSPFPKYRFAISNVNNDLTQNIKDIEAKIGQNSPGAMELSALATLQISQARATGDLSFYRKAELNAERSLQILPHFNDQSLLVLARVAEANHQFDRAISLATKTISGKFKTEALSILVTSYLAQGNLKEASVRADQLIEVKPGVGGYPLRALVLDAQGRKEEAEYDYKRALIVEDLGELFHSAWARALLARFYLKDRNLPAAEELLTECLRIYPKYPFALDLLGELEIQRNN
ncbi:MAG: tetratricopeptide repeat protein, partial [Deltaproteobacteria bacterium]